jgi:hypothetical protein
VSWFNNFFSINEGSHKKKILHESDEMERKNQVAFSQNCMLLNGLLGKGAS